MSRKMPQLITHGTERSDQVWVHACCEQGIMFNSFDKFLLLGSFPTSVKIWNNIFYWVSQFAGFHPTLGFADNLNLGDKPWKFKDKCQIHPQKIFRKTKKCVEETFLSQKFFFTTLGWHHPGSVRVGSSCTSSGSPSGKEERRTWDPWWPGGRTSITGCRSWWVWTNLGAIDVLVEFEVSGLVSLSPGVLLVVFGFRSTGVVHSFELMGAFPLSHFDPPKKNNFMNPVIRIPI